MVVFEIYFAILHKTVAINNVQLSIEQAKGKKLSFCAFALHLVSHVTHPGHLLLAHGCMEEFSDICERCVVIFLKTIKGVTFNLI